MDGNNSYVFLWDAITYSYSNVNVEIRVWITNCIPLIYIYVIYHPCPNPAAKLAYLYGQKVRCT